MMALVSLKVASWMDWSNLLSTMNILNWVVKCRDYYYYLEGLTIDC